MILFSTIILAEIQHVIGVLLSWLANVGQGSFAALGNLVQAANV